MALYVAVAGLCVIGTGVRAQTGLNTVQELNVTAYPATFQNVIAAAIKLNALDLTNDNVIDDFAKVNYCDVYRADHLDEFRWRRVRAALRAKIDQDKSSYPTTFFLDKHEGFGAYDFDAGALPLLSSSVMRDVTQLRLLAPEARQACGTRTVGITQNFVALLDKPVRIDSVKMSPDEAQAVVSGLQQIEDGVVVRTGYGRYIVTLDSTGRPPPGMKDTVLFLSRLLRVTFYEDAAYTKPFWRGLTSLRGYAETHKNFQEIPFKGIDTTSGASDSGSSFTNADPTSPAQPAIPH